MSGSTSNDPVIISVRSKRSKDIPVYTPPQMQRNPEWVPPSPTKTNSEKKSGLPFELQFEMEFN